MFQYLDIHVQRVGLSNKEKALSCQEPCYCVPVSFTNLFFLDNWLLVVY